MCRRIRALYRAGHRAEGAHTAVMPVFLTLRDGKQSACHRDAASSGAGRPRVKPIIVG